MTTTTDHDLDTATPLGDAAPSAAYDDCTTADDINARYKELYRSAQVDAGLAPTESLPLGQAMNLGEDMRRAFVRLGPLGRPSGSAPRRIDPATGAPAPKREAAVHIGEGMAVETDAGYVITCRVCDNTKPVNKFPTLRNPDKVQPPPRGDVCRECRDIAVAAAKGQTAQA